jgi:transposase-like protein
MFDQKTRSRAYEKIMVTIATFNEPAKAKHLKERLQSAGLKADIHNEGHLQQVAFMSRPQANVKVQVDDDDFERAQSLMVEWETSDPDIASAIIRCPQCGSSRIEYPQLTRKAITPAMASVLFALKIFPKEFYCEDCHFTWSNEDQPMLARLWHRFFPGPELEKKNL